MTDEIVNLTLDDAIKLGVQFQQQNNHEKAAAVYQQILAVVPDSISALSNLAVSLIHLGHLEQGIQQFTKITELTPTSGDAFMNLANALVQANNLPLALENYVKAVACTPEHLQLHENFCNLLMQHGDGLIDYFPAAIQYLEKILKKIPQAKHINIELALMYHKSFNLEKAIEYYRKLPKLGIKTAELYNQLGLACLFRNLPADAENAFLQAVKLNPNFISPHINLGICYEMLSKHQKSIEHNLRAIEIDPNDIKPYNNLANLYKNKTNIEESLRCYRKVLELEPNHTTAYSNLLLSLHYHIYDKKEVFEEHKKYAELCKTDLPQNYLNTIEKRKLRIGYLSPDFKKHSVAFFIEPIIESHDREKFEIYCYYLQKVEDSFTERFKNMADKWLIVANLSTPALAQEIYNDKIDILVDLAGHTGNNRLPLLACKPAPIQMTYLGYPDTTGLSTVDYRIVDNYVEPEEEGDLYTTEKPLRVPHSYFCYTPIEKCPATGDAPALKNGYITFGSFNNYAKVSDAIVDVWAAVLKAIPASKFLLKNQSLKDPDTWEHFKSRMADRGIDTHRLHYSKFAKSTQDHLRVYQKVDIALDSFPYNGATTTFEALWMGVPVVTLVGNAHVSRVGKSILKTLGFDNLIANTADEFVTICQTLANDVKYVQNFRQTIREKMQNSPVMDAKTFTRQLEELYQRAWNNWCENRSTQNEQISEQPAEQLPQTQSKSPFKKVFFGLRHNKPDYCL